MKKLMVLLMTLVPAVFSGCSESNAVGIIGGADGPTAIFVGGDMPLMLPIFIVLAIIAVILLVFFITRINK